MWRLRHHLNDDEDSLLRNAALVTFPRVYLSRVVPNMVPALPYWAHVVADVIWTLAINAGLLVTLIFFVTLSVSGPDGWIYVGLMPVIPFTWLVPYAGYVVGQYVS